MDLATPASYYLPPNSVHVIALLRDHHMLLYPHLEPHAYFQFNWQFSDRLIDFLCQISECFSVGELFKLTKTFSMPLCNTCSGSGGVVNLRKSSCYCGHVFVTKRNKPRE